MCVYVYDCVCMQGCVLNILYFNGKMTIISKSFNIIFHITQ